jgi:hypothetical protein
MTGTNTYTNIIDDNYVIDNTAPTFASASFTASVNENIATSTTIFTASASTDDNHALSYSLSTGDSGSLFNIDATTGAVTFKSSPNYENLSVYNFAVIASDWAGNKATENIRLNINNLDEVGTFAAITGNATSGGVITAGTLTDQDGIIAGSISYDWQYLDNGIWRSYNPAHSNASETLSAVEFSANANPHQVRVVANYSDLFGQHTLTSTLVL